MPQMKITIRELYEADKLILDDFDENIVEEIIKELESYDACYDYEISQDIPKKLLVENLQKVNLMDICTLFRRAMEDKLIEEPLREKYRKKMNSIKHL